MRYLHLGIHVQQLRGLFEVAQARRGPWFVMLIVRCPGCSVVYFAEPDAGLAEQARPVLRAMHGAARDLLGRECPDHAHRFELGE